MLLAPRSSKRLSYPTKCCFSAVDSCLGRLHMVKVASYLSISQHRHYSGPGGCPARSCLSTRRSPRIAVPLLPLPNGSLCARCTAFYSTIKGILCLSSLLWPLGELSSARLNIVVGSWITEVSSTAPSCLQRGEPKLIIQCSRCHVGPRIAPQSEDFLHTR